MALLSCQDITIGFGGPPLVEHATFQVERGERIGLLGRNGEGKSTLLKVLNGDLDPDSGQIVQSSGVRVAYLDQQAPTGLPDTVAALIRDGLCAVTGADHEVDKLCSLLQLDPEATFSELSGGQQRSALLGRALAARPDVLLLDEPTNHLDLERIAWLEAFLVRFNGSLLFVTHDRAFLQGLATRIIALDRGHLTSWSCDYPTYLRRREDHLAAEGKQWAVFDKKLAQEEAWIRQGVKARRTRNEGRVRALERLRLDRAARRERRGQVKLSLESGERSGAKVIAATNLHFAYPDQPPLVKQFSTTLMRGDKVGIIGPNGCGKSTLIQLLLHQREPLQGTVKHGTTLQIAYFDQHRDRLDENQTVFHSIANGSDQVTIGGQRKHVIGYLQDFLFEPDRCRQPVKLLSGGERNRLLLARLFTRPANLLVLDEPTNDLDIETLELLEEKLLTYDGTVLVVSHDRHFLDNLCSHSLVFEGDGVIGEYVGGYTDWQEGLAARQAAAARAEKSASAASGRPPPSGKKLSNKEREEWRKLPERIESLEAELAALEQQMADAEFFRGDPDGVRTATERAQTLPSEIEAAYARWASLDARGGG